MNPKSPFKLAGPLMAIWAILCVIAYCGTPEHVRKYLLAIDGLRLWSSAPISLPGILFALPGHLKGAGAVVLGLALAWFAGGAVSCWFRGDRAPFRLGLGLGAGSLGILGLGMAGLLFPPVLVAAGFAFAALGWSVKRSVRPATLPPGPGGMSPLLPSWVAWSAFALAVASFLLALLGALAPETGYDSLIQHLADPRAYLASHRMAFNDLSFLAQHPAGIEMLYLWLLPIGGDTAARIMHACLGALSAWAFWHWLRLRRPGRDALLLACVLYLVPFTGIVSARSYIDNGLIFFGVLTLLAPSGSWLQGACVGLAIGAKYLGGFYLAGWLVALAVRRDGRGMARVFIAASLVGGWWGARNLLNTGNPVYPFAFDLFGGLAWDARSNAEYTGELASYGAVQGFWSWLAIPWTATVYDRGALDDGSLGPLFLGLAPLLWLVRPFPPAYRPFAWNAGALWALWLVSPRQVRYALPLLAPLLAALVPALDGAARRWPQAARGAGPLLVAVLLLQCMLSFSAIYVWINPLYVAVGAVSRPQYLVKIIEPRDIPTGNSLYMEEAFRLKGILPRGSRTYVMGDAKVYYMDGDYLVNALFNAPLIASVVRTSRTPGEAVKRMRQRGITHVLYNVGGSIHIEYTHRMFSWTDREFALLEGIFAGHLRPVDRLNDANGDPMYMLFALEKGSWPDPPYLPGLDTREAFVEMAIGEGRVGDARREAAELLRKYPSSGWLKRWLKRALAKAPRRD